MHIRSSHVGVLCIAAILGVCVFLILSPELLSLASGGSQAKFHAGDCVTGDFASEGEQWAVADVHRDWAVETYTVEEITTGRQQAVQVQRMRPCEAPSAPRR